MQVKHIDHLNLSVHNIENSVHWYHQVFDFNVVENGTYQGSPWYILKAGEALLCLYENKHREFLSSTTLQQRKIHGLNHFALRISDRSKWEHTVQTQKIPVSYGGAFDWPHSRSWYIQDPSGYEIEVVSWNDDQIRFENNQG